MTDRSPLDIAYDAIPQYRGIETALATLKTWAPVTRPPTRTKDRLTGEVVNAARTGADRPADIGARASDAERGGDDAKREADIFDTARRWLERDKDEALQRGAEDGLRALAGPLQDVLTAVRDLAPTLAGAGSAEQAMKTSPEAASAWAVLGQLADRHAAIRAAQLHLTTAAVGGPGGNIGLSHARDVMSVVGWLANLDTLWPSWLDWKGGKPLSTVTNTQMIGEVGPPPWPHDDRDPLAPLHSNPGFLLWLANSEAQPWIPTIAEAAAAFADAKAAAVRRRADAAEIRQYGHVRTDKERQHAAEAAEAKQREDARQMDWHRRAHPDPYGAADRDREALYGYQPTTGSRTH